MRFDIGVGSRIWRRACESLAGDIQSSLLRSGPSGYWNNLCTCLHAILAVNINPLQLGVGTCGGALLADQGRASGVLVDYGAQQSARHGHARFGRRFPGLYRQWDAAHPVQLIGHSMGGQTVRMLVQMLRDKVRPPRLRTAAASVAPVRSACSAAATSCCASKPTARPCTRENPL